MSTFPHLYSPLELRGKVLAAPVLNPLGYMTDLMLYRWRQRRKATQTDKA